MTRIYSNHRNLLLITLLLLSTLTLSACRPTNENFYAELPSNEAGTADVEEDLHVFDAESDLIIIEEAIIALLLLAAIVAIVTKRLRAPYTVGLVLIGLMLSTQGQYEFDVTPELFLALLVPPLVFEAAFHLKWESLRNDLAPILALAIPGVLLTTGLVGLVVSAGTNVPLSVAMVFGALVAATDPVAVVALFRTMGVPKRLQVLLEGESLLNDGTAIVVFNLMITIAITGQFSFLDSIFDFVVTSGGGVAVGILLGLVYAQIIRQIDDPLIETTLTAILAFGSYLLAEKFHVSGVLAVVSAGLLAGNVGPREMSASSKMLVFNFWEIAAFLANSLVFLLIGLQIDPEILITHWAVILVAIGAVLVARAAGVYGLTWVGRGVPRRFQHVLFWGGLRGAISLALAISLPASLGVIRGEIQAMAFGVVLFTLLFQGLTMQPLIKRLNLIPSSTRQTEYERRHARAIMSKAAYDRLETMYNTGMLTPHVWESLAPLIKKHNEKTTQSVLQVLAENPDMELDEYNTARREALLTQRSTLSNLLYDGVISDDVFSELTSEIDEALTEFPLNWLQAARQIDSRDITNILFAVLQEDDVEAAIKALKSLHAPVVQMPSTGEFLGQNNVTIMIGIPDGQEAIIAEKLQQVSHPRVQIWQDEGKEDAPGQEITVGALLFSFDVERYEEL